MAGHRNLGGQAGILPQQRDVGDQAAAVGHLADAAQQERGRGGSFRAILTQTPISDFDRSF